MDSRFDIHTKTNYFDWWNDQEVTAHNSHGLFPMNKEEYYHIKKDSEEGKILCFAIVVPSNDGVHDKLHIGNLSLQRIDWVNRSAEFAAVIGERDYWGKGYCTSAARLLFHHGFNVMNLHRIWSGTSETNKGMLKVFENLNMTQEGVFRDATYLQGKYHNVVECGVLVNEWA
jgi:RimJ/RimL family protein N-acetyltransferase